MTFLPEQIPLPESDEKLLACCHIETFRATGSGGQHINTTNSAVRLTYQPYGIVVTCQQERSQYLNKMMCLKKLREKIKRLNYRPPKRIETHLPFAKKEEGLNKKSQHSKKKKLRGKIDLEE